MRNSFSIIAAVDQKNGLGKNNTLVWRLPSDLKHFSDITTIVQTPGKINAVIMGRKTWESLPPKSKPLKDRLNLVLSREANLDLPEGVLQSNSLDEALSKLQLIDHLENIFVIGGGTIYEQAIHHPACEKIYLTRINATFDCDTFFPKIDETRFQLKEQSEILKENDLEYQFLVYKNEKFSK